MKKDKIVAGTGIFSYKGKCSCCGEKAKIDINGECCNCYQDNTEHKGLVKFECDKCGCYFWVKDRNDFKCPNCEDEIGDNCLECGTEFDCQTDIQLCEECMDKFDTDKLWKLHDENKLDALDFNESKEMREEFRLK